MATLLYIAIVSTAIGATTMQVKAQTSSWQQRADPAELPSVKTAPAKPIAPKSAAPKAGGQVRSQDVAPSANPTGSLSGAAKGPALKPSLATPLGPATTSGGNAHATSQSTDPAYEAFDQGKYLTALELAQKAAEKGDAPAHTLIARIHAEGLGVPPAPVTAAKWYAKGAELGDIEAAFGLGVLHAQGKGLPRNYDEAARLFEMAAVKGHLLANYNLGLLFLRGQGKAENPVRAFRHIEYAAERGIVAAQYDLGTLYTMGTGTDSNAFKGAAWIARAARAGHAEAEMEYAVILFKVDADPWNKEEVAEQLAAEKQGAQLFRSAAEKGMPVAQNRLARCYHFGKGVAADPIEAAKWHLIAREAGIDDEVLEKNFAKLPKADRLKAEKAADEWRDKSQIQ